MEFPNIFFFLLKGVVRGFFLDREGKDITDCLFSDFGSAIWPSMSLNDAARINLEAISDCIVLKLSVTDYSALNAAIPRNDDDLQSAFRALIVLSLGT